MNQCKNDIAILVPDHEFTFDDYVQPIPLPERITGSDEWLIRGQLGTLIRELVLVVS